MKILITGASGLLGRSLLKHLQGISGYECTGTALNRAEPPLWKLNLLNNDDIAQLMDEISPEVVVHCAAERFPDRASADPERTLALNVDSSKCLAKECARVGARLLYISTDYVFDGGVKSGILPPYLPDMQTMPINLYGESKLAGEEAVLSIPAAKAVVVRIPVLYAYDCQDLGESASLVIAKSLLSKSSTTVDNWGKRFPTPVDDVSEILRLVVDAMMHIDNPISGVRLHVSSSEQCTKYELVRIMAEIIGLDASHIQPDSNPPAGALRPQNTQLNCTETWKVLGMEHPYKFTPLRDGMEKALGPFMEQFDALK